MTVFVDLSAAFVAIKVIFLLHLILSSGVWGGKLISRHADRFVEKGRRRYKVGNNGWLARAPPLAANKVCSVHLQSMMA